MENLGKTNWQAISAVGTLLAVIVALLKKEILGIWWRPKFKSNFIRKDPYVTYNDFNGQAGSSTAYCVHIEIENSGNKAAKDCIGSLEEIYSKKNGGYEKIEAYIPMILRWVREDFGPTVISPGQKKYLDVGYIQEKNKDNQERHFFQFFFKGYSDFFRFASGNYRLKIIVYSENTRSKEVWLEINWSGNWVAKYKDMLEKELLVTIK